MPAPYKDCLVDGISVVTGGMNSGMAPRLLLSNQVALAVNLTGRGGLPKTRPVYRKVGLAYESNGTQTAATQALFQDAHFYQAFGGGENCLLAQIGGRTFRYLVQTSNAVQEVSIAGDYNSSVAPQAWMWQGEDFLFINDGQSHPLYWDGAGLRRSAGEAGEELPAGCMGAYIQGRNWMVLPDRQSFMAGDLVYSHGFSDGFGGRKAILKTEENTFLSGGGAFSVPISAGKITALASVAIADTSLGQGPTQVMTQTAVFSVNVPALREDWALVTYPLMVVGLPNYGSVSQSGVSAVNGDLWHRSLDGIRSYQVGRRDLNTWVNTPQSFEVERILQRDSQELLGFCSSVLFSNRYLVTCSPYRVNGRGVAHKGLIALDFNNISGLSASLAGSSTFGGVRSMPAYDGLWTGLPILKILKGMFNGAERCFAFALDKNGDICLYELLRDGFGFFDFDGTSDVGVESVFETRAMSFADKGNTLKKLITADLYLDKLGGTPSADFVFQYRSDEDPIWVDWHNFSLCAPLKDCSTANCPTFADVRPQYRTFLRLPEPSDSECSQITRRQKRTGYEFQLRVKGSGFWQLNRMFVWALAKTDSVITSCPTSENCVLLTGCDPDEFGYSIER